MKSSSWFKCQLIDKRAPANLMFGPSEFKNEICWLYPNRMLKLNSTLLWLPEKKIHIGIASYVDAQKNNDQEALKKLAELGIPLGMKFSDDNDFSGTYVLIEQKDASKTTEKKKKKPSVKVMVATYDGTYDDGTKFKAGDLVKITFRKHFVGRNADGKKEFENGYERP